jgi:DNA-binding response OmpR family regulator
VDILFFSLAFNLFTYSAFVVQIGMTFALLKRFRGMYKGLEQYNLTLEATVAERNNLLAQIETYLSHTAVVPKSLAKGSLSFDIISGRAFIESGGETRDLLLKQKEFAVLLLLAQNEGKTLDAQTIYENVWKLPLRDDKNTLRATISTMRKKIDPSGYTVSVIRGEGYVFERI